jgi:hypothetical protein
MFLFFNVRAILHVRAKILRIGKKKKRLRKKKYKGTWSCRVLLCLFLLFLEFSMLARSFLLSTNNFFFSFFFLFSSRIWMANKRQRLSV